MLILVTGAAGYIGGHTCVELLNQGHDVIALDNFCNSKPIALSRIEKITAKKMTCITGDVRDKTGLRIIFKQHAIDAVIHFAGLKAVSESVAKPLFYYDNNVQGSVALLEVMEESGIKNFVFSSSATVYGFSDSEPIAETASLSPANPYGHSKLMVEQVLRDLSKSDSSWNIAILRYFNPVGAHQSGLIGEDPTGVPNNLMPYITQVAIGRLKQLRVFGDDYATPDGTGVRDYIHVVDLALGHIAAINAIVRNSGLMTVNLGSGQGVSVLELVHAFEKATGVDVPYEIVARRPGDIAMYYADPKLANQLLNWTTQKSLEDICRDAWRWQSLNPNGFV